MASSPSPTAGPSPVRAAPLLVLAALLGGLLLGLALAGRVPLAVEAGAIVGTLWLNGLQMTVVPLVVALLVTGIADAAAMARAGRMTGKAIGLMIALLWAGAAMAALLMPALLAAFPLPEGAAAALRRALGGAGDTGPVPAFGDFLRGLVPTNPVTAAAENAILPLIVFTLAFAFALIRAASPGRDQLTALFRGLADTMLVLIGWVLWLAPLGVFALAVSVGARAGSAAFGALAHYVALVVSIGAVIWIAAFVIAWIAGGRSPLAFLRAAIPAQAVAIATQSSLASLPAMVQGVRRLGVGERTADVVLPIAVALFRATGPAMNLAVVIYVAHLMGVELTPGALAIGIVTASLTTLGAVSLPGSVSFVTSITPIAIAMGVPVEPLALLLAIEAFPDIMRTLANVCMDMGVTVTIARSERDLT